MLVLQRKREESVVIDENVTISILEIGTDWVKLAIDAPKDVKILRSELVEAANINQEASGLTETSILALTKLWKKR